jgi:hypothetical protein
MGGLSIQKHPGRRLSGEASTDLTAWAGRGSNAGRRHRRREVAIRPPDHDGLAVPSVAIRGGFATEADVATVIRGVLDPECMRQRRLPSLSDAVWFGLMLKMPRPGCGEPARGPQIGREHLIAAVDAVIACSDGRVHHVDDHAGCYPQSEGDGVPDRNRLDDDEPVGVGLGLVAEGVDHGRLS